MIEITEVEYSDQIAGRLIELSGRWYEEDSCYGYRINDESDIKGNRIFLAMEDDQIIGYLYGSRYSSEKMTSIMENGTSCFEIEEFYVIDKRRNQGIGRKLFEYVEEKLDDVEYITLSCANRNYLPALHLYVDELGMSVHSMRLYKKKNKE